MSKILGGTFEEVQEAIVKPVRDEVGKALEQGAKSVVHGPGLTAKHQQKPFDTSTSLSAQGKQQEQVKLAEARRKIKWWKDLEEAQRRVRDQQKQKIVQKQSLDTASDKQIKQFEIVKKQKKDEALMRAQRKTEIRGGVGG